MNLKVDENSVIQLQMYSGGLLGQFETLPKLAANSILEQDTDKINRYEIWFRGRSLKIEMMKIEKVAKVNEGKCYDNPSLLCQAIINGLNDVDYEMEKE